MNLSWLFKPSSVPGPDTALPGRSERAFAVPAHHAVNGRVIEPPFPDHLRQIQVGMGCFWGAERIFWKTEGVWTTAVGYAGGHTPNPTYREVCSGQTGHTEAVLVVYDPSIITDEAILKIFFENHDPTQGMRQGNDVGTQYRSAVYWTTPEQKEAAERVAAAYGAALSAAGRGGITTEIAKAGPFWYAEAEHQQYLHKVPGGYCGLGGTGVSCPMPEPVTAG